jgi:hypothetical protein
MNTTAMQLYGLIDEPQADYETPDLPPHLAARIRLLDTISAWGLFFRVCDLDYRIRRAGKATTERDRRRLGHLAHAALNATEVAL